MPEYMGYSYSVQDAGVGIAGLYVAKIYNPDGSLRFTSQAKRNSGEADSFARNYIEGLPEAMTQEEMSQAIQDVIERNEETNPVYITSNIRNFNELGNAIELTSTGNVDISGSTITADSRGSSVGLDLSEITNPTGGITGEGFTTPLSSEFSLRVNQGYKLKVDIDISYENNLPDFAVIDDDYSVEFTVLLEGGDSFTWDVEGSSDGDFPVGNITLMLNNVNQINRSPLLGKPIATFTRDEAFGKKYATAEMRCVVTLTEVQVLDQQINPFQQEELEQEKEEDSVFPDPEDEEDEPEEDDLPPEGGITTDKDTEKLFRNADILIGSFIIVSFTYFFFSAWLAASGLSLAGQGKVQAGGA